MPLHCLDTFNSSPYCKRTTGSSLGLLTAHIGWSHRAGLNLPLDVVPIFLRLPYPPFPTCPLPLPESPILELTLPFRNVSLVDEHAASSGDPLEYHLFQANFDDAPFLPQLETIFALSAPR